jgi:hypothetical protein
LKPLWTVLARSQSGMISMPFGTALKKRKDNVGGGQGGSDSLVISARQLESSSSPSGELASHKNGERWIPVPLPPPAPPSLSFLLPVAAAENLE